MRIYEINYDQNHPEHVIKIECKTLDSQGKSIGKRRIKLCYADIHDALDKAMLLSRKYQGTSTVNLNITTRD